MTTPTFIEILKDTRVLLDNSYKVIDISCWESVIIRLLDLDITSVDVSKNTLELAKDQDRNYILCAGSMYELLFKKDSFDLAIAADNSWNILKNR